MKLVHWVLTAAFFTASCDLILVFKVGGTIRFAQILILFVMIAALAQILQSGVVLWPRGASALALWCLIQGLLITQSPIPAMSAQLYAVLIFTVLGLLATLQLYGRSTRIGSLMLAYLASFVFIALFGIFQLVSPSLHLGTYFVTQWIRHGQLPRINAFSYEPSYFATYLIMGWIAIIDLKISRARIVAGNRWSWFIVLLTCALLFSSSKTALLLVIFEGLARLTVIVSRMARKQALRLRTGSLLMPLPRQRIFLRTSAIVIASLVILTIASRFIDPSTFLSGTGINNTAAHSVVTRKADLDDTLAVIRQHPWIGRSLGGVPGDVAALHGIHVTNFEEFRLYWGFPVPVDMLAASGILGIGPFLWFFLAITAGERTLIAQNWPDERAKWLRALIRALIYEWLCFVVDQNLMRVYFWFHVTMVVIVGYNLRYSNAEKHSAESPVLA